MWIGHAERRRHLIAVGGAFVTICELFPLGEYAIRYQLVEIIESVLENPSFRRYDHTKLKVQILRIGIGECGRMGIDPLFSDQISHPNPERFVTPLK